MSNRAQTAADAAKPSNLNDVLWKELQAVRPELTQGATATPPLEKIYDRIGQPDQQEPLSAICLSGGGIRSATFNLGVLERPPGTRPASTVRLPLDGFRRRLHRQLAAGVDAS